MKTILKPIVTISVILFAFFFSGCEKDLYDESIYQHNQVTQEKVSFSELMAVIKDPTIKSYLSTIRQDISTGLGNGKLSDEELLYFQKFVKENSYTSYSLRLNDFSPEKPYYLDLVIKTDDTTEKAGFIKYLPDEAVAVFDARSFTGRIEVSNLKDHVVANNLVVGGVAVNASGSAAASECFSTIELVQHNCTHGENHAPGEACNGPGGNDGYYEIIITNICLTYPEDLNFIAAPDASMGSNTGSGGPESSALNSAYNFFTSNFLNEYQGAVLAANPKLKDYLMANNLSEESKAIVIAFIDQCLANPTLNLDFEASLNSPCFIDVSLVSGNTPEEIKFREIYGILQNSSNFRRLFSNLFGESPLINVTFKIDNLPQTQNGHLNGLCGFRYYTNQLQSSNLITIDRNHLLNDSNVKIALTIIHEFVHAYLNVRFKDPAMGFSIPNGIINNMDFQTCINTYYNSFNNPEEQHSFFVDFMVPTMVDIFMEVKDLLLTAQQISSAENPEPNAVVYGVTQSIPSVKNYDVILPWSWEDYFTHLCFDGLQNSTSFTSIYPPNSPNLLNQTQYLILGIFLFN